MKELRKNMRRIGVVIICLFLALAGWYAMTVWDQGELWASDSHNARNRASTVSRGSIIDRSGVVLASTDSEGNRVYLEDEEARRAMSHTVGDSAGMSGTGVETRFAAELKDVSGSMLTRLSEIVSGTAHEGNSIALTVSSELTTYVASVFPDNYHGAVVILNYKTGEILTMVSMPDYDPAALLSRSESTEVEDSAYLNLCLQGLYTPGSVFKVVTLSGALQTDASVTEHEYTCTGKWDFGTGTIVCGGGSTSHGTITLRQALARSCNVTFGKLAYAMGTERMVAAAENMGFNLNFQFTDITLYNSVFPTDITTANELVWAGIGQGTVQVTPMHMCMIASSIANGGVMMEPILVRQIKTSTGQVTRVGTSTVFRTVMDASTAGIISDYMKTAVESGTASNAKIKGVTVCGKTGTAQVTSDGSKKDNSWFIGFIDDEEHPYAIAVVIAEGGAGSNLATRLAAKALTKAIGVIG